MALYKYCLTRRILQRSVNYILYVRDEQIHEKSVMLTSDALDDFTTNLIQRKSSKWDAAKEKVKTSHMKNNQTSLILTQDENKTISLEGLDTDQIDKLLHCNLDDGNNNNLLQLIEDCIEYKKCPSTNILIALLSFFSQIGNQAALTRIIKLCEIVNPTTLASNSNFAHYIAEAISVNGDTNTALSLFEKVYDNNVYLRRRIRLMLKYVILEIINYKSEAAIVALLKFCEKLLTVHNDIYPMSCMWEACFLSEWYSEQSRSLEILKTYPRLFKLITGRINYIVTMSLKKQQIDSVLRFLEYLLENKHETQYSIVLVSMFDYNFRRRNFRFCREIVNWSKKYNISTPKSLDDKYLDLILRQMTTETIEKAMSQPINEFKF